MGWFIKLALLRLRSRWRSLLTLMSGVLLAAIIGANAPLYTTAISQVGMVDFLTAQPPPDTNIYNRISIAPVETDGFAAAWQTFDAQFSQAFEGSIGAREGWVQDVVRWAETQPLFIVPPDDDSANQSEARLAYYEHLREYATLVDGDWAADAADGAVIEVMLPVAAAEGLELAVGDTFQLDQRGWDSSEIFEARLSGIIDPTDAESVYWYEPSPLRVDGIGTSTLDVIMLTTRANLAQVAPTYIPEPNVQLGWRVLFDHTELPFSQIDDAVSRLELLETDVRRALLTEENIEGTFVYETRLPALLNDYATEIVFLNVPFGLLMLQLGALVIFFLVLIAALVRRGERREIAMLQSRGALDRQIIWLRTIETLFICLTAALLAPFIAQRLLMWYVPALTNIAQIPLTLRPVVFGFAAAAAALAFVVLMATLLPILRQPLIDAGGSASRSDSQTWWQRYYLDVVLLVVGTAALVQVTNTQSLVADSGETAQADPLLLLTPTLLFLAFSSVLLRFFPAVMSGLASLAEKRRSLALPLASWQVSREPLHYGRIAFLLALAIGIGWFAISYQATLFGNQQDRAEYAVGSDVRIIYEEPDDNETQQAIRESIERIRALPQVAAASDVARLEQQNMATGGGRAAREKGFIIATDTDSLPQAALWRDDLGELPIPAFDDPTATQDIGLTVPPNTETLVFRAQLSARFLIDFTSTETFLPYPVVIVFEQNDIPAFQAVFRDAEGTTYVRRLVPDGERIERFLDERPDNAPPLYGPVSTDGDRIPDTIRPVDLPNDGWLELRVDLSDVPDDARFTRLDVNMPTFQSVRSLALALPNPVAIDADGNQRTLDWIQPDAIDTSAGNILPRDIAARSDVDPTVREILPRSFDRFGDGGAMIFWNSVNSQRPSNSRFSLLFDFPKVATVEARYIENLPRPDDEDITGIPVTVNRAFADLNEFTEGQRFTLSLRQNAVWFELTDVVTYFPTLYPETPILVVNREALNYTFSRLNLRPVAPNELWLRLTDAADTEAFVAQLRQADDAALFDEITSVPAVLNTYQTDVLSLGVIGLLFLSFVVGLLLSIVSLFTYISLSVQERLSNFAMLRALGIPNAQLILSVMIEQLLVLLTALLLGSIIGQFLTLQVLPPLAISAAGGSVTPPFALQMDWVAIAQYLVVITVILLGVLALSALWLRRRATVQALRFIEE